MIEEFYDWGFDKLDEVIAFPVLITFGLGIALWWFIPNKLFGISYFILILIMGELCFIDFIRNRKKKLTKKEIIGFKFLGLFAGLPFAIWTMIAISIGMSIYPHLTPQVIKKIICFVGVVGGIGIIIGLYVLINLGIGMAINKKLTKKRGNKK